MPEKTSTIDKFRLKANASFAIREGWLTKGLRFVAVNPAVFIEDDAVKTLGIGSAMVKSLRVWMQACGLATEPNYGKRFQTLTTLGNAILENDLYFEDYFSLYLVHYNIASNTVLSTVWYLLFSNFRYVHFDRETMIQALLDAFRENTTADFAVSSFRDDCSAALKTYTAEQDSELSPEENMQCPLSALDLFIKTGTDNYEVSVPPAYKLHEQAVLYVLLDRMNGRDAISFDKLLTEPCNVGKIFHLTPYRLNAYLDRLQSEGALVIERTAGLNMIYPKLGLTAESVLSDYYGRK